MHGACLCTARLLTPCFANALYAQAYITELEERNLTLQEKVYLLEERVKELQAQLHKAQGRQDSEGHREDASEDGSENEHIEHSEQSAGNAAS